LGYRKIADHLNQKGLKTHKGNKWGGNYVYAVLKRYDEKQDRERYRMKKYPITYSKMWIE